MDSFPFTTPADWGLSDEVAADVEEQKLGDGYILRRPKGINHLRESWSPSWSFLTKLESQQMYAWLKPRLQLIPFKWTHPDTGITHKVICKSITRVSADVGLYTLKITLEEDFNL